MAMNAYIKADALLNSGTSLGKDPSRSSPSSAAAGCFSKPNGTASVIYTCGHKETPGHCECQKQLVDSIKSRNSSALSGYFPSINIDRMQRLGTDRFRIYLDSLYDAHFLVALPEWYPNYPGAHVMLETFDVLFQGVPSSTCVQADTDASSIINTLIAENPLSIPNHLAVIGVTAIHRHSALRVAFANCSSADSALFRGLYFQNQQFACQPYDDLDRGIFWCEHCLHSLHLDHVCSRRDPRCRYCAGKHSSKECKVRFCPEDYTPYCVLCKAEHEAWGPACSAIWRATAKPKCAATKWLRAGATGKPNKRRARSAGLDEDVGAVGPATTPIAKRLRSKGRLISPSITSSSAAATAAAAAGASIGTAPATPCVSPRQNSSATVEPDYQDRNPTTLSSSSWSPTAPPNAACEPLSPTSSSPCPIPAPDLDLERRNSVSEKTGHKTASPNSSCEAVDNSIPDFEISGWAALESLDWSKLLDNDVDAGPSFPSSDLMATTTLNWAPQSGAHEEFGLPTSSWDAGFSGFSGVPAQSNDGGCGIPSDMASDVRTVSSAATTAATVTESYGYDAVGHDPDLAWMYASSILYDI